MKKRWNNLTFEARYNLWTWNNHNLVSKILFSLSHHIWRHKLLLRRMLTVINTKPFEKKKPNIRVKLILIISIIVGILLLSLFIQNIRFSFFGKKKLLLEPCRNPKCTVNENDRFDCHPEKHLTETKCKRRCCCWHGKNARVPCFFPSNYLGYVLQESVITEYGFSSLDQKS